MNGFASSVRMFTLGTLQLIGNCNNGCVVGLTEQGAQDCASYVQGTLGAAELEQRQPELVGAFRQYGFFHDEPDACNSPQSAYLHVTDRCNMNCVGCYSRSDMRNAISDLSLEEMRSIIDKLVSAGVKTLHISGGEPALRSDLCDIIEYAKQASVARIDLATNGLLAYASLDLDRLASCIDGVSVSVDGLPDGSLQEIRTGESRDQQLQAIRILQAHGINVTMLPTIHAKNIENIPAYADLADIMGVPVNYSVLSCSACNKDLGELTFTEHALHRLAEIMAEQASRSSRHDKLPTLSVRLSCGAGKTTLSVAADGRAYPCHMLQSPEYCMGDILHDPMEKILGSRMWNESKELTVEDVKECSSCAYRYLCGGGCRARATVAGGLRNKDPYCALLKKHYANLAEQTQRVMKG